MDEKKYPWLDRSLKNIKGERWRDIPGLEGYFMVSDFGRVRRLEYEVEFDANVPDIVDEVKEVQKVVVGVLSKDGKTLTETGYLTTTTVKISGDGVSQARIVSSAYTITFHVGAGGYLGAVSFTGNTPSVVNNPDFSPR
jgi:hypothetical protein